MEAVGIETVGRKQQIATSIMIQAFRPVECHVFSITIFKCIKHVIVLMLEKSVVFFFCTCVFQGILLASFNITTEQRNIKNTRTVKSCVAFRCDYIANKICFSTSEAAEAVGSLASRRQQWATCPAELCIHIWRAAEIGAAGTSHYLL